MRTVPVSYTHLDVYKRQVQQGSAWWFNDHKDGMEAQLKSLASLGLLGSLSLIHIWNSRSTKAMAVMTRKDGRTTPRVAQRAPVKPQTR